MESAVSTDYGDEFQSILAFVRRGDQDQSLRTNPTGLDVSAAFESLIARRSPTIIYFPPGHYVLGVSPDRTATYHCGKHVQLFFANNALLQIGNGVTLVVDGSLRAGSYQIFGRNRSQRSRFPLEEGGVPRPITWSLHPLAGRVVITSDLIPCVRPEWWGALPVSPALIQNEDADPTTFDSSEALQAAIDVAAAGRAGRAPLPVLLGGPYQCCQTLEARRAPPRSEESTRVDPKHPELGGFRVLSKEPVAPVTLILRGKAGIGTGGGGAASIVRTRSRQAEAEFLATHGTPEAHPALLRMGPGVDFEIQDVNLRVEDKQLDATLPAADPTGRIESCVEVRCDATERSGRRGLLRRTTLSGTALHQLRVIEEGELTTDADAAAIRRQFVLDSCSLAATDNRRGGYLLRAEAGEGVMLHVSDTVLRTPIVPASVLALPSDATFLLAGASVLVEAALFHRNSGPRPSNALRGDRRTPDFARPDGQDFYLDRPLRARVGTHLTVMQCESQSWWFLGRHPAIDRAHNTVLVGVTHSNVNWQYDEQVRGFLFTAPVPPDSGRELEPNPEAARFLAGHPVDESGRPIVATQVPPSARPGSPPSVVWFGEGGHCVLSGCAFGDSIVTDQASSIFDVGTIFRIATVGELRTLFRRPDQILTWPNYRNPSVLLGDALDERIARLVPIGGDTTARMR